MEASFPPDPVTISEGADAIPDTSNRSDGSGGVAWGPTMGTGNAAFSDASIMPPSTPMNPEYSSSTASVFSAEQQQQQGAGGSITRFASHTPTPAGYVSPFAAPPAPTQPTSFAARSQQAYSSANQSPYGGGVTANPSSYPVATTPRALPPQPSYTTPSPQQQPSVSYGGSPQQAPTYTQPSYAPQQSYTAPRHAQQQPYASQPQAQSYAARSVLYGQPTAASAPPPPTSAVVPPQPYRGPPSTASYATATTLSSTQKPTQQQRILNDAIRNVQEHSYYMKMAMDQNNLAVVLDRAAHMVGELGGPPHGPAASTTPHPNTAQLTPKNYYELYMRALEDMPVFEEYLFQLAAPSAAAAAPSNPQLIRIVEHAAQLQPPSTTTTGYTMRDLYDCVQYCPRVVSRLYLQIATGAAWIRSADGAVNVQVMRDLQEAVRCEQNPVRGLFVRYFLITALRDKLPDRPVKQKEEAKEEENRPLNEEDATKDEGESKAPVAEEKGESTPTTEEHTEGTVKDSYEFILSNFMEMNKLWVRIQHLPGEGKDKEARKRRERERNDLRILVGTNLVRLAQLECVTSQIYGQELLPPILEHIVTTGDPLSQAYLMDCLVQVFPDEYHIETLPILLNVCPRLRDKVNIRTILQGLMDRLAKYLVGDAELLDEQDTNEVKLTLARDSFGLFEECVQKVYNARGPKLTAKEVIRLQTALLQFSLQCFPGNVEHVGRCIDACVTALRQAHAAYGDVSQSSSNAFTALDDASVAELEKLLSIPLETLALNVLQFEMYPRLISFLPWLNRREVALAMLQAAVDSGSGMPQSLKDLEQLLQVLEPLLRDEHVNAPSTDRKKVQQENGQVAKMVHALQSETKDTNMVYSMLQLVRQHILPGGPDRTVHTLSAVVFAALQLARRVHAPPLNVKHEEDKGKEPVEGDMVEPVQVSEEKVAAEQGAASQVSSRKIFVFIQETIEMISKNDPEKGIKLSMSASSTADGFAAQSSARGEEWEFGPISYEFLRQAMTLYEDRITDPNAQCRCITSFAGTLLALKSVDKGNYETLVTKCAQFSAKVVLKPEQCQLVALCAYLFFPADNEHLSSYQNPQRALECLQRSLKLADACTSANAMYISLFVDLLEHYLYFFEKRNPLITPAYIGGLVALIKEHLINQNEVVSNEKDIKAHFMEVVRHIKQRKVDSEFADLFSQVQIDT